MQVDDLLNFRQFSKKSSDDGINVSRNASIYSLSQRFDSMQMTWAKPLVLPRCMKISSPT